MFPPKQETKGKHLFSHQPPTIFSILQFSQASETLRNVFNTYTASVVISKENIYTAQGKTVPRRANKTVANSPLRWAPLC